MVAIDTAAPAAVGKGEALPADTTTVGSGLLCVLLGLAVAGLGSPRAPAALALVGETVLIPAAMFLTSFALDGRMAFTRAAQAVAIAVAAALFAMLAALSTRQGWRAGLDHAAPALRLLLLPLVYAVMLRPLRKAPMAAVVFLALLCHVAGVIVGGRAAFVLAPLPWFVIGALVAARGARFLRLIAAEPEYAAASGAIVLALGLAVAARARGADLTGVGPLALLVGFAAGPALLAGSRTLAQTRAAPPFARIGRAAPALAIGWLPLFHFLLAIAHRGAPPRPASLLLFSATSFLLILAAADIFGAKTQEPAAPAPAR